MALPEDVVGCNVGETPNGLRWSYAEVARLSVKGHGMVDFPK